MVELIKIIQQRLKLTENVLKTQLHVLNNVGIKITFFNPPNVKYY